MQKEKNEEEYLKDYLNTTDKTNTKIESKPEPVVQNTDRLTDLQYFTFETSMLPLGIFYPKGTVIMVRAAQVREIQAYSMVEDTNFYDMVEKMNDMLSACVRVKYSDGTIKPFTDLKDGDRIYVIFLIRELTFQKGISLTVSLSCKCGTENTIELKRSSFIFWEEDETLSKYFDDAKRCFRFVTNFGETFEIAPPSIGIQKCFTEYIIRQYNEKKSPNLSFLKIMPFQLFDRQSITYEGIQKKLEEYVSMNMDSFQFLNSVVGKMNFGIKELAKKCTCGQEVRTDMTFPGGPSAIFVIQNGFEQYIKK